MPRNLSHTLSSIGDLAIIRLPHRVYTTVTPSKPRSTAVCAHSSWFRIENQGMKDFDLLARGSAFFVQPPEDQSSPVSNKQADTSASWYVAGCGHVAAPFRFRHYYQQEWLDFVKDEHCYNQLDFFPAAGDEKSSDDLAAFSLRVAMKDIYLHPHLDLVIMHIPNRAQIEHTLYTQLGIHIRPLELKSVISLEQDQLKLLGHSLHGGHAGSGEEKVLPEHRDGSVSHISASRIFVKTESPSVMGMCGGPAVGMDESMKCVGMLEGIVAGYKRKDDLSTSENLMDHSVLIPSEAISDFVKQVVEMQEAK